MFGGNSMNKLKEKVRKGQREITRGKRGELRAMRLA